MKTFDLVFFIFNLKNHMQKNVIIRLFSSSLVTLSNIQSKFEVLNIRGYCSKTEEKQEWLWKRRGQKLSFGSDRSFRHLEIFTRQFDREGWYSDADTSCLEAKSHQGMCGS